MIVQCGHVRAAINEINELWRTVQPSKETTQQEDAIFAKHGLKRVITKRLTNGICKIDVVNARGVVVADYHDVIK